ncbi:GGDEF domain-containing protein [uncultured Bradyrhizobium sp.]|uniref:GGDEF domain-containing protein n=1 Tax=uncultured Bradyrhizobium sp. TaxID=199684 RepID=UPI0035CBE490
MKKKSKPTALKAVQRRKSSVSARKVAPSHPRAAKARAKSPGSAAKSAVPIAADSRQTIRRLRLQLAKAVARISELDAAADQDFLLDIPNRRGFERELNRSIAYIKRYHASGALIVLDVDRLKPINDAYGHAAGDEVLKAIVAVLLRHVRSSDVVGRLGGDEFALLLWNLSETDAHAKAASLEQAVDGLSFVFRGCKISAGASAGVAILGTHAEASKALEEADSAMYVRKAQRRHEGRP